MKFTALYQNVRRLGYLLRNIFAVKYFTLLIHIQYLKKSETKGAGAALGHIFNRRKIFNCLSFLTPSIPNSLGYYFIFRAILENFSHQKTQQGHIVEVGGKVRSCCLINSTSGLCEDSSSTCMKLIIDHITSTTACFLSIRPLLLNPEGPTDLQQG